MCGICGILKHGMEYSRARAVTLDMCRVMAHRGPDDEGVYVNDDIALGMRRLSIIDLETGHQPIFNEDRSLCLIVNGEIYNYAALRDELVKKGHKFSTRSDSEVLVHLYEENGIDCLDKVNGMFAFALWDGNQKELFVARDRIGIKPLYYSSINGGFMFGSELKSLLQHPFIKKELDLEALGQYLTYEYVPAPLTILKGIKKLLPGHFLRVDLHGRMTIKQYWDYNYCDKIVLKSEGEYKEAFLEKFFRAVKRRMISDVPLGTFLSGGIDSGMIAAAMQTFSPGLVDSFNIGFEDRSFDESVFARGLARDLGLNHRYEICTGSAMIDAMDRVLDILDEPLGDNSVVPTYLLCQYCRKHVTVALSGDGGDELFAGYPTYQAHKLAGLYDLLPVKAGRGLLEKAVQRLPVSTKNFSFDFKAKKFISGLGFCAAHRNQIWLGSFSPLEQKALFLPYVANKLQEKTIFGPIDRLLKSARVETRLDSLLYLDMKLYLQEDLLVKVDRISMANALEVRVPFLDHELVDFVTRLPDNMKLRLLTGKYLLKKSAVGLIPEKYINRPKKGFGTPLADWIKGPLKEMFCDTFSREEIVRQGLFNHATIDKLLNDHFQGKVDNRQKLWTLFVFQKWCQRYL